MKLNLGCGAQVVDGWTNVDFGVGARFAKVPLFSALNRKLGLFKQDWDPRIHLHDLTRPFPWPDASVDVVYTSHTLEHFAREAGLTFLTECRRVLKAGGILRIVVPDLQHWVREYTEGRMAAEAFVESIGVLYRLSGNPIKDRLASFIQYPHRCLYDTPALLRIVTGLGFEARSRAGFDSGIPDIRVIEMEEQTRNAVVVEGVKVSGAVSASAAR